MEEAAHMLRRKIKRARPNLQTAHEWLADGHF